jgi:chromosome segregation ATPase
MPKNTLLLILAILISMVGFWYFKSSSSNSELTPELAELSTPRVLVPASKLKSVPDRKERQRVQAEQEVANLESQITQESQKLEAQKQILEQLRQRTQSVAGRGSYRSQINSRDLEIQNLIESLGSYRQAEEDLNRSATRALRDQDSGARVARDQLEANIQFLEQEILNTQNELHYWQNYLAGPEMTNQRSEIEKLQNQLTQQKNELNRLRSQQVDISVQVLSNSQAVEILAERAKAELRSSAAETQAQIFSLRSEVDRLQEVQSQRQSQLWTLSSQLTKLEKDYEEQSRKLRFLQEALRAKQSDLHSE